MESKPPPLNNWLLIQFAAQSMQTIDPRRLPLVFDFYFFPTAAQKDSSWQAPTNSSVL
jgi:hypothetical protein